MIGYIIFIALGYLISCTNELRKLLRFEEEKIKHNNSYATSVARKREVILEVKNILRKHKIKVVFFYIIEFLLMILFWYYVTIFCNIYQKTIISWLLDCIITVIFRVKLDIFKNFIFSALYKCSIHSIECVYKLILILYNFYF